jgi:hypothetical protein
MLVGEDWAEAIEQVATIEMTTRQRRAENCDFIEGSNEKKISCGHWDKGSAGVKVN